MVAEDPGRNRQSHQEAKTVTEPAPPSFNNHTKAESGFELLTAKLRSALCSRSTLFTGLDGLTPGEVTRHIILWSNAAGRNVDTPDPNMTAGRVREAELNHKTRFRFGRALHPPALDLYRFAAPLTMVDCSVQQLLNGKALFARYALPHQSYGLLGVGPEVFVNEYPRIYRYYAERQIQENELWPVPKNTSQAIPHRTDYRSVDIAGPGYPPRLLSRILRRPAD
jgi:hypothetical protein